MPFYVFGSDVVVSCPHADAACLKMDVFVRADVEAAYPQMDVKPVPL